MDLSSDASTDVTMDAVVGRRHLLSHSRHSLIWAAINGLSALMVGFDIKYSFIESLFDSYVLKIFVLIFDIIIAIILCLNSIYNTSLWFWKNYFMTPLELTSHQMKAFGVKDNEFGFKLYKPIGDPSVHSTVQSLSPSFELSFVSDLDRHSSLNSTQLSNANISCLSDGWSSGSLDTTSTSWQFDRHSSPMKSPDVINGSKTGFLRMRRTANKSNINESIVANERELEEYLKDFELKEQRLEEMADSEKRRQANTSSSGWTSSLLNQSLSQVMDESNESTYQFAIDSPLRINNIDFDSVNTSATASKAMDFLLAKLKINETILNQWIENIRKWISLTILCRVVEQIDKINDLLVRTGHFDALIGQTSLQNIKQMVVLKKPEFSSLANVLPFLELSSNQQYLVHRIRDLAKGGCIGQFKWNSGAAYNSKPWNEDLITDSAIVMQSFCAYMDLRLPSNPNSPDGKAFTNSYFKATTGPAPKCPVYIFEAKTNPPHYKVWTEEEGIWELSIGRNNLFHAILVFIHCIKDKQLGHLGRINLGSSGLNILWVIHH